MFFPVLSRPNNDDKSSSYIRMKSSRVSELAQKTLDWIKQERANKLQKHLDNCRRDLTKTGKWHEWWQKYTPTDEEVRAYAYGENANDIIEDFNTAGKIRAINAFAYNLEQIAKQLLAAARDVEEMWVSAHDWQKVNP